MTLALPSKQDIIKTIKLCRDHMVNDVELSIGRPCAAGTMRGLWHFFQTKVISWSLTHVGPQPKKQVISQREIIKRMIFNKNMHEDRKA